MSFHHQEQGEACHFMKPALERTAAGTANLVTRTAARIHTATCSCCREHLAHLREQEAFRTSLSSGDERNG